MFGSMISSLTCGLTCASGNRATLYGGFQRTVGEDNAAVLVSDIDELRDGMVN